MDLYKPIKAGLEFFYPRMNKGGYIFVHDFKWGRVRNAVTEFCTSQDVGYVVIPDQCQSAIIVKG